ncbi:hypothetical protein X839_09070 [Streptococcus thermophilus MTH17CL396]|nr:hypothetical protein X839_09070 [Streptococcus thermophilus MTH17CL396]
MIKFLERPLDCVIIKRIDTYKLMLKLGESLQANQVSKD